MSLKDRLQTNDPSVEDMGIIFFIGFFAGGIITLICLVYLMGIYG
jgi:hypothetical protein